MRPITRGDSPGVFTHYRDAGDPLTQRLGSYCSYCERYIETHRAVEHIRPKVHTPHLERTWSNLLLACSNCNSCKGDIDVQINGYLWPDTDNTLRAFKYNHGLVEVEANLNPEVQDLASALHQLVGLDKDPGNPSPKRRPTSADERWRTRQTIWGVAQRSLTNLQNSDTPQMRSQIIETAVARGCFAIWFTVFRSDADMRQRLIAGFPGTATDCFDGVSHACQRPGGNL